MKFEYHLMNHRAEWEKGTGLVITGLSQKVILKKYIEQGGGRSQKNRNVVTLNHIQITSFIKVCIKVKSQGLGINCSFPEITT